LFSRIIKDRKAKTKEKAFLEKLEDEFKKETAELRTRLVDKLIVLVSGKTSQGVMNSLKEIVVSKGTKFTQKILHGLDYAIVNPNNWTTDKSKNDLIKELLHNYSIKYKDLLGFITERNLLLRLVMSYQQASFSLQRCIWLKSVS
jgi:DNA-directed RNA polymerase subunit beta